MRKNSGVFLVFLLAVGGMANASHGSFTIATADYSTTAAVVADDCQSQAVLEAARAEVKSNISYINGDMVKKLTSSTGGDSSRKKFRKKSLEVFSSAWSYKVDDFSVDGSGMADGHLFCDANMKVSYQTADYGNIVVTELVIFDVWSDGQNHFVELQNSYASDYIADLAAALKH